MDGSVVGVEDGSVGTMLGSMSKLAARNGFEIVFIEDWPRPPIVPMPSRLCSAARLTEAITLPWRCQESDSTVTMLSAKDASTASESVPASTTVANVEISADNSEDTWT